jgi:mannitol/fructose-specific phosphotransferase system IIA component (Ntr-type)
MAPSASKLIISSILVPETIELGLSAKNRDEIFRELIEHIPGIKARPEAKKVLLRAVMEREQMHSTGVGDGIAIPHARNAVEGMTDHAVIVFGRHDKGISYGAVDGAPVRLFFLLIASNISEHLQIMARISRLLRDTSLRDGLLSAKSPGDVISQISAIEQKL